MKWWFEKKRNQPRISPWNCHSSPRKMDGWKTFSSPGFRPIFWGGELLVLGKGIRFSSFSDQPFDSEQKNIQTKGTLIVWTEFSPFPLYFKESKVKELLELPRLKKKHGTPPPPNQLWRMQNGWFLEMLFLFQRGTPFRCFRCKVTPAISLQGG